MESTLRKRMEEKTDSSLLVPGDAGFDAQAGVPDSMAGGTYKNEPTNNPGFAEPVPGPALPKPFNIRGG